MTAPHWGAVGASRMLEYPGDEDIDKLLGSSDRAAVKGETHSLRT